MMAVVEENWTAAPKPVTVDDERWVELKKEIKRGR